MREAPPKKQNKHASPRSQPRIDKDSTGRNPKGKRIGAVSKIGGTVPVNGGFLKNAGSACHAVYAFVSLYVGNMYRVMKRPDRR